MNNVVSKLGAIADMAEQFSKAAADQSAPAAKWLRRAGTFLGVVAPIPGPGKFIASFAAGTAVGLIAGLAIAPASGAQTRRRIFAVVSKAAGANPTTKKFAESLFGTEPKSDRDADGPGDAEAAGETREAKSEDQSEEKSEDKSEGKSETEVSTQERNPKKRNGHARASA